MAQTLNKTWAFILVEYCEDKNPNTGLFQIAITGEEIDQYFYEYRKVNDNWNLKEKITMSKSLYEQFADIEQPKALREIKTFEDAIESLESLKSRVSAEYIDWAEEVTSISCKRA
jgi:hypothetical protein